MARLSAYTTVRFTEEWPEDIASDELVVRRVGDFIKGLHFLCPCGCGDPHMLPMRATEIGSPTWQITVEDSGAVTVSPSVLRRGGCQSHFFIRQTRVEWC